MIKFCNLEYILEDLLKTIGDRITYCRSLIGLTRKEFSSVWGKVSVPTLSRWELDVIQPSPKKIAALVDFFCSKGLMIVPEWLEKGIGIPPAMLHTKEFVEEQFDAICEYTFKLIFHNINNHLIYYKVTSNFFSPVIRYGDYVGGTKISDNKIFEYVGSLVFIVQDNSVCVGFLNSLNNTMTLKNAQGKTTEFVNYGLIAKVDWTAIRP
jgi:transcriptional regulator with XRE-family HTH domain